MVLICWGDKLISMFRLIRSSISFLFVAIGGVALTALLFFVAVISPSLADTTPGRVLQFGVLNQQSPIQTAERWNPVLRYLSAKTGIPLQLKMGRTVQMTDAMMGNEEFDLIFTNHNFQQGYDGLYRVLVRWAGKPIHGVLVAPEDSPLRSIKDLQGKKVAFPSAAAFVAYAVPKVALKTHGVSVREVFAANQEGALAQLKARQVEAAAVNSRFLTGYAERENLRYRTLYQSEPFHEMPVLIHPRIPATQAEALRKALLGMRADPDAAAALKAASCPGFEAAADRDYDNIRVTYRAIEQ